MVYEDNGEIYYTYSDNDGESWSKEIRISEGIGGNSYPSISCISVSTAGVVWQYHNGDFGGKIKFRMKKLGSW